MRCETCCPGRNNAHIDRAESTAHRLYFALLQCAQQLRLHLGGRVAHFVKKQAAFFGLLEITDAVALCAGKGAPRAAEQHCRRDPRGNRRHIDRYQRPRGTLAGAMHRACHQFLAATGLASNQYIQTAARNACDIAAQSLHVIAAAEQARKRSRRRCGRLPVTVRERRHLTEQQHDTVGQLQHNAPAHIRRGEIPRRLHPFTVQPAAAGIGHRCQGYPGVTKSHMQRLATDMRVVQRTPHVPSSAHESRLLSPEHQRLAPRALQHPAFSNALHIGVKDNGKDAYPTRRGGSQLRKYRGQRRIHAVVFRHRQTRASMRSAGFT